MERKIASGLAVLIFLMAAGGHASIDISTAVGSGADTFVGNDSKMAATKTNGGAKNIQVRKLDGQRQRIGYLRFDISGATEALTTGATLSMESIWLKSSGKNWDVYGLTDETLDSWNEATTCYNNAPGMLSATLGNFTIDTTKLSKLGFIATPAVPAGGLTGPYFVLFSSNTTDLSLDTFIAADTNKLLTFVLISQSDCENEIATKEHTDTTLLRPTLTLVPEPATLCLLGLGGLVVARRKTK